jgi:hypothetical protein
VRSQKLARNKSAVLVNFLTVIVVQKTSLVEKEKGAVTQIPSVRDL